MRHAVLGGGKRLRPFLLVETATLFGAARDARCWRAPRSNACMAIRWYMTTCRPWTMTTCGAAGRPCTRPSMRRRRSWRATRLLTLAFDVMRTSRCIPSSVRITLVDRAGARFRPRRHGRRADARSCRRRALCRQATYSRRERNRRHLQAMKTGALIRFACRAWRHPRQATALPRRAHRLATARPSARRSRSPTTCSTSKATAGTVGKATGKDAAAGKATLVSTLGVAGCARTSSPALIAEADAALAPFGAKADTLRATARFIAERKS